MNPGFVLFTRTLSALILAEGILLLILAPIQDSAFSLFVSFPIGFVIFLLGVFLTYTFWMTAPSENPKEDKSQKNVLAAVGMLLIVGSFILVFGRANVESTLLSVLCIIDGIGCLLIGLGFVSMKFT